MTSGAPDAADLAEIAPTGVVRAAINVANAATTKVLADGALAGPCVDLATAFAQWLGLPLELVRYESAREIVETTGQGQWDVTFLAIDPKRAATLRSSTPYLQIEATYAVRAKSPLRNVDDVDQQGVRICTTNGAAYDLQLQRILRHAQRVTFPRPKDSYEAFRTGDNDAIAGVRQSLEAEFGTSSSARILDGGFHRIDHAMMVEAGRTRSAALVDTFMAMQRERLATR